MIGVVMIELRPNVVALTRAVEIRSIRFIQTKTDFGGFQAGDVLDKMRITTRSAGIRSPDASEEIRAFVGLDCDVLTSDQSRRAGMMSCDLAIDYKVSDEALWAKLEEQDYAQFAATSSLGNAWPFIREFCLSASQKMGLPPVVLPILPIAHPASPTPVPAAENKQGA